MSLSPVLSIVWPSKLKLFSFFSPCVAAVDVIETMFGCGEVSFAGTAEKLKIKKSNFNSPDSVSYFTLYSSFIYNVLVPKL